MAGHVMASHVMASHLPKTLAGFAGLLVAAAMPLLPAAAKQTGRMYACTQEWRPVCAEVRPARCKAAQREADGRCKAQVMTFSNLCTARRAGARLLYLGKCRKRCGRGR